MVILLYQNLYHWYVQQMLTERTPHCLWKLHCDSFTDASYRHHLVDFETTMI